MVQTLYGQGATSSTYTQAFLFRFCGVFCGDPISMRFSTFEIRSSFISVFLFIDSILKNSATINKNEINDRNDAPLWRTSPHLEEVFLFGSMIGSN